jgi:hypothetical protein
MAAALHWTHSISTHFALDSLHLHWAHSNSLHSLAHADRVQLFNGFPGVLQHFHASVGLHVILLTYYVSNPRDIISAGRVTRHGLLKSYNTPWPTEMMPFVVHQEDTMGSAPPPHLRAAHKHITPTSILQDVRALQLEPATIVTCAQLVQAGDASCTLCSQVTI